MHNAARLGAEGGGDKGRAHLQTQAAAHNRLREGKEGRRGKKKNLCFSGLWKQRFSSKCKKQIRQVKAAEFPWQHSLTLFQSEYNSFTYSLKMWTIERAHAHTHTHHSTQCHSEELKDNTDARNSCTPPDSHLLLNITSKNTLIQMRATRWKSMKMRNLHHCVSKQHQSRLVADFCCFWS